MNNFPERNHKFEDDDIDLRRYFGLFLSNWYWFVGALFIAGMIAYGINTYSERVYTVTASMLIKDDRGTELTGLDRIMPGGDMFRSQQNLQNEIGILKSYSVNARVMEELKEFHVTIIGVGRKGIAQTRHYKSAPFFVTFDTLSNQKIGVPVNIKILSENSYSIEIDGANLSKDKYRFGEKFSDAGFEFTLYKRYTGNYKFDPASSNKYILKFNRPENLANYYRSKLSIQAVNEEATLVTLSVTGVSRMQEADYLNNLMDVYIKQGLEYKNETAEKTIEFIDKQLGLISDSLSLAENTLEQFRLANKLIDLSSEGLTVRNKLERFNQEEISMRLQKQYYEYVSDYLNSKNESGEIISPNVMGVTDPLFVGLIEELSRLQNQKKQLSYYISDDQPAINLVNSRIKDVRTALGESVRNNLINITKTLEDIETRIKVVENDLNRLPGTERKLINIQRTFDLNNTVYTYMLEKRSEAGIAKASNVSGNRIIDYAEPFNAYLINPKSKRNYLFAIILGFLIPGAYIFLVDQLHNKIVDKKDIEKGTTVPIIGFVGHNTYNSEIPVIDKPGSSLAESFRSVRTNLKYYLNGQKNIVISVTSTISGEGKTFVSLNLASVLAVLGKKTLLVGIDLRKPRLNKILKSSDDTGLSTYLIGETNFNSIISETGISNLFFVASGPIPPNPSELLESENMKKFIEEAKKEFDYIVLDTPPVGIVSDALLLGEYSDMNIFIIRQKFSFKSTLDLIQDIFEKKELRNLTIAVNDIHVSGYYGYGLRYGYGFYQGYGYKYGYNQYGVYGKSEYGNYYNEN